MATNSTPKFTVGQDVTVKDAYGEHHGTVEMIADGKVGVRYGSRVQRFDITTGHGLQTYYATVHTAADLAEEQRRTDVTLRLERRGLSVRLDADTPTEHLEHVADILDRLTRTSGKTPAGADAGLYLSPEQVEDLRTFVSESELALHAAKVINQRTLRTGTPEALHLANHDRLSRKSAQILCVLGADPAAVRFALEHADVEPNRSKLTATPAEPVSSDRLSDGEVSAVPVLVEHVRDLGAHLVDLGLAEAAPGYGHATGTQVAQAVFAWLHDSGDTATAPAPAPAPVLPPAADGERFDFDGHFVTSVHQGVEAVISHHVSPVVGRVRLADAHGETLPGDPFREAFRKAASVVLDALAAHGAARPLAVTAEDRTALRRALTIARHDQMCSPGCGDDLSTYPWVSDGEVDAAITWAQTHVGHRQ